MHRLSIGSLFLVFILFIPTSLLAQDTVTSDAVPAITTDQAVVAATDDGADVAEKTSTEPIDTEALNKQLLEIGSKVDTLKEDSFTTKSRLLLLREEVLRRSLSGSRIVIVHKNEMGGQYELTQINYVLDNEPKFTRQDSSGKLSKVNDEVIYEGVLAPGTHQLNVSFVYKGRAWGVFRYMKAYTFRVSSGYSFSVEEGKSVEITVSAVEQGNFFTPYEERADVNFELLQFDLLRDEPENEAATASSDNAG